MLDTSVTNILDEKVLIQFQEALSGVKVLKVLCIGDFNPLSRLSCEFLYIVHKNLHDYKIVSQSKPTIIVPLFKKKFINESVWESSLCGLANHRNVDYVIDSRACDEITIIDRLKPDFIFFDRRCPTHGDIDYYIKKMRIKASRV